MIKKLFKIIFCIAFLLSGSFLVYSETDIQSCDGAFVGYHDNFFQFIDPLSEAIRRKFAEERGFEAIVAWNDPRNDLSKYMPMEGKGGKEIFNNPDKYVCDAAHVLKSAQYDQSQKAYAIMLMHFSSVRVQIYLLKTANEAYEKGIITDKEVLAELLYSPELNGASTNSKFTWLPAWRREFQKHAHEVLSKEAREEVLSGRTLLWGL